MTWVTPLWLLNLKTWHKLLEVDRGVIANYVCPLECVSAQKDMHIHMHLSTSVEVFSTLSFLWYIVQTSPLWFSTKQIVVDHSQCINLTINRMVLNKANCCGLLAVHKPMLLWFYRKATFIPMKSTQLVVLHHGTKK